ARDVEQAAVADRHRAPPAAHRAQRKPDEGRVRAFAGLLRRIPRQRTAADLPPPQAADAPETFEEVGAGRPAPHEALDQEPGPEGREAALGGAVRDRDAAATDRPRILVLGAGVPGLLARERLHRQ